MVRAIFLDIDGVICCNQFGRLEDRKLQLLRGVVQQTGAKIVLSTDWRRVPKLKSQLIATLRDYGMEVIGSTPMRAPWQPVRPQEITDWLTSYNNAAVMGNGEPIHSFVAVDDRSLLQESGGDGLRGARPPPPRRHPALRAPLSPHPRPIALPHTIAIPRSSCSSFRTVRLLPVFSSSRAPQVASCTRATSPG
jgi:hypothetical protein